MSNAIKTLVEFSTANEDITVISICDAQIKTTIIDKNSNTGFCESRKPDGTFLASTHFDKSTGKINGLTVSVWGDTIIETDYIDGKKDGYQATYINGQIAELNQYREGMDRGAIGAPDLSAVPLDDKRPTVLSNIKQRMEAGKLKL